MSATVLSPAPRTTRAQIDEFLAHKRFAAIGVSRNPNDFTRKLVVEFENRGYEVLYVNPEAPNDTNRQWFASVQQIQPPVEAALLLTSPSVSDHVARECFELGVKHIWFYRAGGAGAVSPAAVALCRERGINVVAGECPFMFLPNTGFPHRLHGLIRKIFGTYPAD